MYARSNASLWLLGNRYISDFGNKAPFHRMYSFNPRHVRTILIFSAIPKYHRLNIPTYARYPRSLLQYSVFLRRHQDGNPFRCWHDNTLSWVVRDFKRVAKPRPAGMDGYPWGDPPPAGSPQKVKSLPNARLSILCCVLITGWLVNTLTKSLTELRGIGLCKHFSKARCSIQRLYSLISDGLSLYFR